MEGAMDLETGQMNAEMSGSKLPTKLNLPNESLTSNPNAQPGRCGMPRAADSVMKNQISETLVTKGGIRFRNGGWKYVSPCENCEGIMKLNPNLKFSDLPPGVPDNLPPNTEIPFTPPEEWLK
jgi:hypothetical protein